MIDHAARDEVRLAIDDYLADRTTNFEFEQRLEAIDWGDPTVLAAVWMLWLFYDDFREHRVCLDKAGWDAMQRVSLLLASDRHAEWKVTRRLHPSQAIAIGMVALLAAVGFVAGWPFAWFAGVLTSPIYFVLKAWRRDAVETLNVPERDDIWPFNSFAKLRHARTQAVGFRKQRFRREIAGRTIHSRNWWRFQQAKLFLLEAAASMFLYVIQCFPISKDWVDVSEVAPA